LEAGNVKVPAQEGNNLPEAEEYEKKMQKDVPTRNQGSRKAGGRKNKKPDVVQKRGRDNIHCF
jgi:hypothetical protein